MLSAKPLVSIIIPTKNEASHIQKCLNSIKMQTYGIEHIEIIIIDSSSSDSTKEITTRYAQQIYNLESERSPARNLGAKIAKGKYVLFLDADMVLSKQVIFECVEKCELGNYIALYIPEKVIGNTFWIKVKDFERSFYDTTCIDAVRFILRATFLRINGFDPVLISHEDWDLDRRIKVVGLVDIIKSPLYHDQHGLTLKKYLQKKKYYSQSSDKYIQKWGKNDPIVKQQLGAYSRLVNIFIKGKNFKKLLKNPLMSLAMYLLMFITSFFFFVGKWSNQKQA